MGDFISDFQPDNNPAYRLPEHMQTLYTIDDRTFCIHIFNACKESGYIPQNANRDHFVKNCKNRMPEIPLESGSQAPYQWDFRNSDGGWTRFYQHMNPNHVVHKTFGLYRADGTTSPVPEKVMQKAAQSQVTPERCRDFSEGDGGPTAEVVKEGALLASATSSWTRPIAAIRIRTKIAAAGAIVMGAIILFVTRGNALSPKVQLAPSLSPTITPKYSRQTEA